MKREKSQYSRMLLFACILLGIFALVLSTKTLTFVKGINVYPSFDNPFSQDQIIVPLPNTDPTATIVAALREKGIAFEEMPLASESAILVSLKDGPDVLFHPEKDVLVQVSSLQIILHRLTIEGRIAKRVDFRFENPLVVY